MAVMRVREEILLNENEKKAFLQVIESLNYISSFNYQTEEFNGLAETCDLLVEDLEMFLCHYVNEDDTID